jgi:hypothetical protein
MRLHEVHRKGNTKSMAGISRRGEVIGQPARPCSRKSLSPASVTVTIIPKPAMVSRAT